MPRSPRAGLAPGPALLLAPILIGLPVTGGGCLAVEAEVPEVELTQRGVVFTGVPAIGGQETELSKSYAQDHSALALPPELSAEIQTLGVTLTATGGVADLSFIRQLRITMSAGGPAEAIEIVGYERAPGAAVGSQLELTTRSPVDVLEAWQTDTATFTLEIAGTLPVSEWTADVTVRFAGRARYSY
jgi:hypothetical protein